MSAKAKLAPIRASAIVPPVPAPKKKSARTQTLVGLPPVEQAHLAVQQINNLDDLRRVDVLVKEKRKELIEKGAVGKPSKSLTIRTVRGRKVIYEQWSENGKIRAHYLGKSLPTNYDVSTVSISDSVKKRLGSISR